MNQPSAYWDALAPHHSSLENNYLDLRSLRRIIHELHEPVLVVGAGQGLLVEELLKRGFQTDGIDLSREMIQYAKKRRGLTIIEADARAMPFGAGKYETIIYATGVIDFMADEELIGTILNEARRVISPSGKVFVAFYRMSTATEAFLTRLGLLKNNVFYVKETMEFYRMNPFETIAWVAKKAKVGYVRAGILALRSWAFSSINEKRAAFKLQKVCRNRDQANLLIESAPESQPYRNESEISNLFKRLAIPIKKFGAGNSCYIAQI